jgi:mannose-6-phosphate isomerase-like protein (cupin superfamily)
LAKHHHISIPQGSWHKLTNTSDVDLVIIEIQHGIECIEEDIERKE